MTVLMKLNQSHSVSGAHCRVEWQGLRAGDVVTARVTTTSGPGAEFPGEPVSGLRPQPYVPNAWLIDLGSLPSGTSALELQVTAATAHPVSMALEVQGAGGGELQHTGLTTEPSVPMVALRFARRGDDWSVMALAGDVPQVQVPAHLREAALVAVRERFIGKGEPVTVVLDVSASMRPRLAAGTVTSVLTALQAVAGAAERSEVDVVAVSDEVHGRRGLPVAGDAEEFIRSWVREIGLRTATRGTAERWVAQHAPAGVVVSVSDQQPAAATAARGDHRVVLVPAGSAATVPAQRGTVVLTAPQPSPADVVRALVHGSPAV